MDDYWDYLVCSLVDDGGKRMLVIARKQNEEITLTLPNGQTIDVVLVSTGRSVVRVGIRAPREVLVARSREHICRAGK